MYYYYSIVWMEICRTCELYIECLCASFLYAFMYDDTLCVNECVYDGHSEHE